MDTTAQSNVVLKILGVIALVLLNGFFVAAEFALVKLRDTQLNELIAKGHRRAGLTRHVLQNITSYLSATQLGITIASIGLGWFGEPVFTALLQPLLIKLHIHSVEVQHSISFAVGFSVITFLQIILGELGPKWFAIQKPLPTSLLLVKPLHWFYLASYPFNWILNHSAQWLLRQVGIEQAGGQHAIHSEEELRVLLGQKRPGGTRLGRDIIINALDLNHRIVRDVMRPRNEIALFDTEAAISSCLEVAEKTRYSRFPLCEGGDLDKTLGVVHIKDLYALRQKATRGADLAPLARKLIYVPETTRLEKLLQLFLERKLHFAVVIDEYGGTIGMVTLENVLEELVGQIQDEFDQEKPLLVKRDDNNWDVDGSLPLHELAELVRQDFSAAEVSTTSGWVTQRLGGFPKTGDVLALGAYQLRVEAMDGRRVSSLKLTFCPEKAVQGH